MSDPIANVRSSIAQRNRSAELIKTGTWHTKNTLYLPAGQVNLVPSQRPVPEPDAALEIRLALFQKSLEDKKDQLQDVNPDNSYEIDHDSESGKNALFVTRPNQQKRQRIMWDGVTIAPSASALSTKPDASLEIPVHPIEYSEWTACYTPEFGAAYDSASLPRPYAGLGISVLIETADGLVPLTRRGLETPVYPGLLYSPGGGPKPGETTLEAFFDEITEETGIRRGQHFAADDLIIMAYVSDTSHNNSGHERPELVAHMKTRMTMREIVEIRNSSVTARGQRPGDVWALEPVLADPVNIGGKILFDGNQMCPPTEAALAHLMYLKLLEADPQDPERALASMEHQLARMAKYTRREFVPPIVLADIDLPSL